jgi:hypothetical protein
MKKLSLLMMAVMITGLSSCNKDENKNPQPEDYVTFFPLLPGNYWIYQNYEIDSIGNATPTNDWDSSFISGDTMIRGNMYFTLHEKPVLYMPEQSVSYLRDSSGYIVDHRGKIRLAENNFSDTLYEDTSNLVLFHGYAAMWAKDSTVTVPVGSFVTRNVRTSVVPTRNNDPYPTRYSYDIYGKNIGRIKFHTFFYASNKHFESRLVRGKVVIETHD